MTLVVHINDSDQYDKELVKAGSKLVVVDFTAKCQNCTFLHLLNQGPVLVWQEKTMENFPPIPPSEEECGPCKMIAPFFEDLSKKYRGAVFMKVDVDECQEIAVSCNVEAMPTFVFYKAQKEVARVRGADAATLESKVKELADSVSSFSGSGQRLGGEANSSENVTESVSGSSGLGGWLPSMPSLIAGVIGGGSAAAQENQQSSNSVEDEAAAQKAMNLDPSSPTTSIQVRLADGTKLTMKINVQQPVSKIREYICKARPMFSARPFSLMTTFPSKEITDEDVSIGDAKLSNSVVMQKLIS